MEKQTLRKIAIERAEKNEILNEMKGKDPLLFIVLLTIFIEGFTEGYNEIHALTVDANGEIKEGGEQ